MTELSTVLYICEDVFINPAPDVTQTVFETGLVGKVERLSLILDTP